MHMCVSHVPFLALMLFLINPTVFSQLERKSEDDEMLLELFASRVVLFF